MRPVERGDVPEDECGNPKVFARYQDARPDLVAQLGRYCSYCEMRLPASLGVEHVSPKSMDPGQERNWDNLLLACDHCNSIKKHKFERDPVLEHYYWPDRDNTFRAFEHAEAGVVRVSSDLSDHEKKRANSTLHLTGLERRPGSGLTGTDNRWNERREAWEQAEQDLRDLRARDTQAMRRVIVQSAKNKGCWSVWMTVFRQDRDMLGRLIEAFPGTCRQCFDDQYGPVPRPGGAL